MDVEINEEPASYFPSPSELGAWSDALVRHAEAFKHGAPPDFSWRDAALRQCARLVREAKSFEDLDCAVDEYMSDFINEAKKLGYKQGSIAQFGSDADLITAPTMEAIIALSSRAANHEREDLRQAMNGWVESTGRELVASDLEELERFSKKWGFLGVSATAGFDSKQIGRLDEAIEECASFLKSEYGHEMENSRLRLVLTKEKISDGCAAYCPSSDYLLFMDLQYEELGRFVLHEYMHRIQFRLNAKLLASGLGGLYEMDSPSGLGDSFRDLVADVAGRFADKSKAVRSYVNGLCAEEKVARFFTDYYEQSNPKARREGKESFLGSGAPQEFDTFLLSLLDRMRRKDAGHFLDELDAQGDKALKKRRSYLGKHTERHARLTELHFAAKNGGGLCGMYPTLSLAGDSVPKIQEFNHLVFGWCSKLAAGKNASVGDIAQVKSFGINKEKFKWRDAFKDAAAFPVGPQSKRGHSGQ